MLSGAEEITERYLCCAGAIRPTTAQLTQLLREKHFLPPLPSKGSPTCFPARLYSFSLTLSPTPQLITNFTRTTLSSQGSARGSPSGQNAADGVHRAPAPRRERTPAGRSGSSTARTAYRAPQRRAVAPGPSAASQSGRRCARRALEPASHGAFRARSVRFLIPESSFHRLHALPLTSRNSLTFPQARKAMKHGFWKGKQWSHWGGVQKGTEGEEIARGRGCELQMSPSEGTILPAQLSRGTVSRVSLLLAMVCPRCWGAFSLPCNC